MLYSAHSLWNCFLYLPVTVLKTLKPGENISTTRIVTNSISTDCTRKADNYWPLLDQQPTVFIKLNTLMRSFNWYLPKQLVQFIITRYDLLL